MNESAEFENQIQTWKLILAYDGTDFSGWQIQPGELTVQGELQAALGRILKESPLPQGSGRTDAGVHALAQVASFTLRSPIPAENLKRALNRTLPASIRVLDANTVPDSFHARHSATAKTYEYRVFRETLCSPFLSRYALACAWPMDLDAMQEAAMQFVGEHDFLSFAATDPELSVRKGVEGSESEPIAPQFAPRNAIRTIYSSSWEPEKRPEGNFLIYRVRGNGFLHHMVRNLVGTMLDVGRGRLQAAQMSAILSARARAAAGPTAPPQGLFLHSVEYGIKD
jgi:tRNA pseudouridine38-40 synthase